MKFTNALVVKLVDTKDLKSLPLAECSSSLAEEPKSIMKKLRSFLIKTKSLELNPFAKRIKSKYY